MGNLVLGLGGTQKIRYVCKVKYIDSFASKPHTGKLSFLKKDFLAVLDTYHSA